MKTRPLFAGALALAVVLSSASCRRREADPEDFSAQAMSASLLPVSPTNAVADDPRAVALGHRLFFDGGFSSDGTIACASCHDPKRGFSDPKAFSVGVRGQTGARHAMPITAAAFHPFLLWDGRADSVWAQPLFALENPKEMDFSRVEVARRIAERYAEPYEALFGPLPDLSAAPPRALPGDAAWKAMPEALRDDVNRVFSHFGKAIEAYERKILCADTRFDRWVRGEGELGSSELDGAGVFLRQGCPQCHAGPSFSDGQFHDVGIPSPDRGRALGAAAMLDNPFNGVGAFSDDASFGTTRLAAAATEPAREGAFRTASLRGAGQRTFFGHAGHQETLRGFLLDVYRDQRRNGRAATVGTLDERLRRVEVEGDEADDLVAFLKTLDCPALPDGLGDPP